MPTPRVHARSAPAASRAALLAAALASALVADRAAALPPHSIIPLVLEGDTIDGVLIESVDKVAVNNQSQWLVMVNANSAAHPEMILRGVGAGPATVVRREGDAVSTPFGPATLRGFANTTAHLDDAGRAALNLSVVDQFGLPLQGAARDGPAAAAAGYFAFTDQVAYTDARFAIWSAFHVCRAGDADDALVVATVDDFGLPGSANRLAARVALTPGGAAMSVTRLVLQGDTLIGQVQPVASISDLSSHAARTDGADFAALVTLASSSPAQEAVNEAIYLNATTVIAQKGMPSPVPGRMWAALGPGGPGSAVDLGNGGDVLLRAALAGGGADAPVLVRNGVVIRRGGQPVPGLAGRVITGLGVGAAAVRTDDAGDALCPLTLDDADPARRGALLFNDGLIAQTGQTVIGGELLVSIAGTGLGGAGGTRGDTLDLSDNGRYIVLVGELPPRPGSTGAASGAFLIRFERCGADFNGDFVLDPDDLGDFINCYFGAPPCPRADFNHDGVADPDDLGDFINAYFGGCA